MRSLTILGWLSVFISSCSMVERNRLYFINYFWSKLNSLSEWHIPRKGTISRLDTSAKLSISLQFREVVQILVREVLNWQVKPWENIRSFLNTCHFKRLFTITSYFRSLFSPLDLVLSTAADITGRASKHTSDNFGSTTEY